jgi:site-specific DNA-methyltransferase (adenine-specific)
MSGLIDQGTLPRNRIIIGDARAQLADMPDSSVDTVITSPPYFRLRDYEVSGQLGTEAHVDEWVTGLREVAREMSRVLVPTGTLWLNLGDTYATHLSQGAPKKSLLLAPERLAQVLLDDGWLIRNKIVWAKTNSRPTSATDRLACAWEVIYLLVRSPRYYFNLDAIRVPHSSRPPRAKAKRPARPTAAREHWRGLNADGSRGLDALKARGLVGHPLGKNPRDVWSLATSNFRGAHFATFPLVLAERMVKAACPAWRCTACRTAWTRITPRLSAAPVRPKLRPGCRCGAPPEPGLVLDPFMGAGTTALAAEQLDRDWLGIELNPAFAALAAQRLTAARSAAATRGGT